MSILENPAVQNAVASIIVIGLGVLGEYLRRLDAAKTASIRDERIRRIVEDLVAAAEFQSTPPRGGRLPGFR